MELQLLSTKVIELVKEVGAFIAHENEQFDESKIELKEFNNLVSYVDKEAEARLVAGLRKILPEAGFITEEGSAGEDGEEYLWIIDPLDGTTNFSHKLPIYSISVGLSLDKEQILGVVFDPSRNECFYAWQDGGAFLNGEPIHVSDVKHLKDGLFATGFPYYMFEKLDLYINILKDLMHSTHGLRRMGSAAIDLCYVACGRFEGFFEYNLKAYDVAGGSVIVREAGGKVTDFSGENEKSFSGEEIIAAGKVHEELQEVIEKNWNNS